MASGPEHDPRHRQHPNDPLVPVALTPELADFLRGQQVYACVTQATSEGTAYVIRAPAADLVTLRGRMPIDLRHELYAHPAAPVIRTVLRILDRPRHPLMLETFCNVAEADQRADFAALATQERLTLLFYDEQLQHRLSKLVPYPDRRDIRLILARAEALAAAIPPEHFDFNQAKAAVQRSTRM